MADPKLNDFKQDFMKIYNSLQSTFSNISFFQRQINEYQDKLKKSLKNKNEITKSVLDDDERLNNLKQEFENIYLKIDDKKFEELEKEKEIKILNDEIIKRRGRLDVENISNFKPQELELQQKLVSEKDEVETKNNYLLERRQVEFDRAAKLDVQKVNSELYGNQLHKEHHDLELEKKEFDEKLKIEKNEKLEIEKKLEKNKKDNNTMKKELVELENARNEHDKKKKDDEGKYENLCSENKKLEIDIHQKKKNINDLTKKIEETEDKKVKELKSIIEEREKEVKEKEKGIKDFKKELNHLEKQYDDINEKIKQIEENIKKTFC